MGYKLLALMQTSTHPQTALLRFFTSSPCSPSGALPSLGGLSESEVTISPHNNYLCPNSNQLSADRSTLSACLLLRATTSSPGGSFCITEDNGDLSPMHSLFPILPEADSLDERSLNSSLLTALESQLGLTFVRRCV